MKTCTIVNKKKKNIKKEIIFTKVQKKKKNPTASLANGPHELDVKNFNTVKMAFQGCFFGLLSSFEKVKLKKKYSSEKNVWFYDCGEIMLFISLYKNALLMGI